MSKYRISGLLLMVVTLLFMGSLAAAQTYNAAADFSATSNPNGVWSYGWSTSRGAAFNLLPTPENAYDGVSDIWTGSGICCDVAPAVFHNGTNIVDTHGTYPQGCCAPFPVGGLGFHPGPNGENTVVRWMAPAAGIYRIKATFSGVDYGGQVGTTTDVAVLHNGAQLFAGNVIAFGSHYDQFYSGTVSVHAGDTIDFTVGYGTVASGNDFVLYPYANYYSDATGLDAVIIPVTQVLNNDVTNLINGSNLTTTQKNQLSALVSASETAITSGNKAAAVRDLKVLVAGVTLLMWSTPPLIPASLGDQVINDSNEAIAALSS